MINGESISLSKLAQSPAPPSATSANANGNGNPSGRPSVDKADESAAAREEPSKLDLLKQLLLEEEHGDLKNLRGKISHLEDHFADRVARDLAVALKKRSERGGVSFDELVAALQAGTESAIQRSVAEDRSRLTSALFPIMGPAIRNYVT